MCVAGYVEYAHRQLREHVDGHNRKSSSIRADLERGCKGCPPPPLWGEAFFFVFTVKICLPHQSVTPFLSGAPPPKKNPGSASVIYKHYQPVYNGRIPQSL